MANGCGDASPARAEARLAGHASSDEEAAMLEPAGKRRAEQVSPQEMAALRSELATHAKKLSELEALLGAASRPPPSSASPVGRSQQPQQPQRGTESPVLLGGSKTPPKAPITPRQERGSAKRGRPITSHSASSGGGIGAASPGTPSQSTQSKVTANGLLVNKDMEDPYDHMWSTAKFNQMRIFDQDLLKSIYNKPYKEVRHQAALVGSGVMGLLSMPFGPIGMAAGGMFGALCGGFVGFCADKRRRKMKLKQSELEKKRLKSLVRWAAERFNEDEEVLELVELVTLEFKPMADIAAGSKNARKLLKLLDHWVAQKSVTRQLWVYMDNLLQNWQDLTRGDFIRSMLVFQTLTTMYRHSPRVLDEQEEQFVQRMERLLEHGSVKSVMAHAHKFPTHGQSRVMECMIYADHARTITRKLSKLPSSQDSEAGCRSPSVHDEPGSRHDLEDVSDDSDQGEGLENYGCSSTAGGVVLAPSRGEGAHDSLESSAAVAAQRVKVLKKPFFKNWDDFMEFDATFKHKMPITLCERDLLLEKESESTKNWDVCVERKEIRVAKVQGGAGCVTLRAWANVPGVNMYCAFFLFYNGEERVKWDKVLTGVQSIEKNVQGSDIVYSLMKIPGTTPRDFLQYRRVFVQEDGSIAIVLRSADHHAMPEGKSIIRVESYISGYVLRQSFENGEPVLNIFLMSCADVKGLIPKWIINMFAPKKPAEWVETLRKACVGYQDAHPNFEEDLRNYVNRFKEDNPYDFEADTDAVLGDGSEAAVNQAQAGVANAGKGPPSTPARNTILML